ncbi:MAG: acyltransferase family protein [Oscillospiraceae bacterium]|nr:acyltransferase family protein [Oscillospiraceae bacterium]
MEELQPASGNRVTYIDFARGLTMLTVIWGHIMLEGITNVFVYSFHMPVFFFLSGMVFSKERYDGVFALIRRRWKTLILPYIIASFISWAWWALRCVILSEPPASYFRPLMQTFIAQGSGGYLIHNVPLWFVTSLFWMEVLYWFLSKCRWKLCLGLSLLCGLAGVLLMEYTELPSVLPWSLEVTLAAMPFYAFGNLCARIPNLSQRIQRKPLAAVSVVVVSVILVVLVASKNGHVTMAQAKLGNPILFYTGATLGIVFVLTLCCLLDRFQGRILDFFRWFGRNSFYAMVVHVPIMVFMIWVVARACGRDRAEVRGDYRYTVPIFLLTFLTTLLLVWCLAKWKVYRAEKGRKGG